MAWSELCRHPGAATRQRVRAAQVVGCAYGRCRSRRRSSGPTTGQSWVPARITLLRAASSPWRMTANGVRRPASTLARARRCSHCAQPVHTPTSGWSPSRTRSSSENVDPQHQQVGRSTCSRSIAAAAMGPLSPPSGYVTRVGERKAARGWHGASATERTRISGDDKPRRRAARATRSHAQQMGLAPTCRRAPVDATSGRHPERAADSGHRGGSLRPAAPQRMVEAVRLRSKEQS